MLLLGALPLFGAGDEPSDRATLRGIAAFNVVIDPVAPDLEKQGATADAIRTRVEERLRDAGIKIDPASNVFVGLRLLSVRAARGPFAIAATIAIYQTVALTRDPKMKTTTQTWEVGTVILAEPKEVYRGCMESADELAARFVTAYQSANGASKARE